MGYQITVLKEKSKEVEECQILAGIDTLYFFIDTVLGSAPMKLYQNLWDSVILGTFKRENYDFINFSGKNSGWVGGWYFYYGADKTPLFKVGFKDPNKQKQLKNIWVQLLGSGIYSMGFFPLVDLVKKEFSSLLGYQFTNENFYPSRVDLNVFVDGFDFSDITEFNFRSRFARSDKKKW